jgi:very-short-patch-repair endonuclease
VINAALQRLATEQHGILTRSQLLHAGVGPRSVDRWIQTGRLIALHRGVFAVGHLPPSPHARTMAAVLACGRGAVLSHRSAAHLYGLIRYSGPIEITAPTNHQRAGVIVHRSALTDRDVTQHWGIPATTPGPHAHRPRPHPLPRLPHPRSQRCAPQEPSLCRRAPAEVAARSDAETDAIVAGYEVDAYWATHRLVAELDGEEFHDGFETDRAKDADLVEAGLRVIRVTWDRLTRQPRREAARFRTLLRT